MYCYEQNKTIQNKTTIHSVAVPRFNTPRKTEQNVPLSNYFLILSNKTKWKLKFVAVLWFHMQKKIFTLIFHDSIDCQQNNTKYKLHFLILHYSIDHQQNKTEN